LNFDKKTRQDCMNDNYRDLPEIRLERIKFLAHNIFVKAKGSHDWDHTLRVFRLCERIGKAEGADMEVVKLPPIFTISEEMFRINPSVKYVMLRRGRNWHIR
jgi:hypothetical protein